MDDLEFVQRCIKGDKPAWEQFLKQYSRLIYKYILHILNLKGSVFAQEKVNDIFQEIICSLINDDYRKLKSFKARNGCSLASWLRQVTINFSVDYLRQKKPEVSLDQELDGGVALREILADSSLGVADVVVREENFKALRECIEGLVEDDKFFLELHTNRGLALEELKGYYKASRGLMDVRKNRILQRLKECFRRKGFLLEF
ncbi:MAG: sigma-70 family RNA polymerase sigma factor [Candidatus Omnitrophica bacterium]|nr:sigma-70 family RNA polymerase sigma factor [Candidatus Omnitrophota bacterium]